MKYKKQRGNQVIYEGVTEKSMNILIVSQYYYPDPFRLHEAAEGLVKRGNKVTVLTGTPNYVAKGTKEDRKKEYKSGIVKGVHIIRVRTKRRKNSLFSLAVSYISYMLSASMKALLLKKDFDVILVYQLSPIIMVVPAFLLRWRSKKKVVIYCLDLWPESIVGTRITRKHILYKLMFQFSVWAYNNADCVAYTSRLFQKYFVDSLKLTQKNYRYIPQFAESIYDAICNVDHYGINYVFAGNIGEAQDVENIVRAASMVKNEQIYWHIVGDGRNYESCVRLMRKLNLEKKVFFYGRKPVDEMKYFFSIADAMLVTLADNPIISYTLPGKVQSYMAAGKPIIAAASGETLMIIREAQCGLYCEPNNPRRLAEIAEQMAYLDRREYGENARKYYNKYFKKSSYMKALENILMEISSS